MIVNKHHTGTLENLYGLLLLYLVANERTKNLNKKELSVR